MKQCDRCGHKKGPINRFAIVEDNILKMLNMCSTCKHTTMKKRDPIIQIPTEGVVIKDIIAKMDIEYKRLKATEIKKT